MLLKQLLYSGQTPTGKVIHSTNSKLISFFESAFFFAEVFPKKYSKFYEKELSTDGFMQGY